MVADVLESTAKSMNEVTTDKLKSMFDKTINNMIKEGLLDEAPVTMKDLNTMKSYMLPILRGFYGKRIEYPEGENNG